VSTRQPRLFQQAPRTASRSCALTAAVKRSTRPRIGSSVCTPSSCQPQPKAGQHPGREPGEGPGRRFGAASRCA